MTCRKEMIHLHAELDGLVEEQTQILKDINPKLKELQELRKDIRKLTVLIEMGKHGVEVDNAGGTEGETEKETPTDNCR
jgi:hypothetical protein